MKYDKPQSFTAYLIIAGSSHELDFTVTNQTEYMKLKPYWIETVDSIKYLIGEVDTLLLEEHEVTQYELCAIVPLSTTFKTPTTQIDTLIAFRNYWAANKVDITNLPITPTGLQTNHRISFSEAVNITKTRRFSDVYNEFLQNTGLSKLIQ
jgi:hypothetical protein